MGSASIKLGCVSGMAVVDVGSQLVVSGERGIDYSRNASVVRAVLHITRNLFLHG